MTLPILLIFYVSKWKNNKKHWKIGKWRTSLGVASQNWVRGFFVRRWSLCVNLMTLALLVPEIQRGVRGAPPPVTDWPKKPSLNGVKFGKLSRSFLMFVCPLGEKFPAWASHSWSRPTRSGAVGECKYCLLDASYHMYSWCLYFDA